MHGWTEFRHRPAATRSTSGLQDGTGGDLRSRLPGVSEGRAPQLVAGAIVADAAMDLMEVTQLEICPWALREGVILRRLDALTVDHLAGR